MIKSGIAFVPKITDLLIFGVVERGDYLIIIFFKCDCVRFM